MKLSEIIKALEDGKTVKADNIIFDNEYFKNDRDHCVSNILYQIWSNRKFEIIEPNKVVELWGKYLNDEGNNIYCFDEIDIRDSEYKITFEVDKDNNPICDTIKMIEL